MNLGLKMMNLGLLGLQKDAATTAYDPTDINDLVRLSILFVSFNLPARCRWCLTCTLPLFSFI